jgi:hypothetical protein
METYTRGDRKMITEEILIFTEEEVKALKEIAQERIRFKEVFLYDENGQKIPRGNYSDWVRAMKGEFKKKEVQKNETL